jgi:Tol biopolymer transport system component
MMGSIQSDLCTMEGPVFENMPEVPEGKLKLQPETHSRMPLIVSGLGCLGILLMVFACAGGWFFFGNRFMSRGADTAEIVQTPAPLTTSVAVSNASVLGHGKIAYSVDLGARPEDKAVWIVNADGSDARQILERASSPAFSPDGALIAYYHWSDGIFIAKSDGTDAHKIIGESNAKYFSWSQDGKWIAFSSQPLQREGSNINLDVVAVDGSQRHTVVAGGSLPSWEPDGQGIIFHACEEGKCGIYRVGVFGGTPVMIIGEMGGTPSWSPDGTKIVYHADTESAKQIFVVNANGSDKTKLTTGTDPHVDPFWSPDGSFIYYRSPEGGNWYIWRMNADGSTPVRIAQSGPPVDWAFERLAVAK